MLLKICLIFLYGLAAVSTQQSNGYNPVDAAGKYRQQLQQQKLLQEQPSLDTQRPRDEDAGWNLNVYVYRFSYTSASQQTPDSKLFPSAPNRNTFTTSAATEPQNQLYDPQSQANPNLQSSPSQERFPTNRFTPPQQQAQFPQNSFPSQQPPFPQQLPKSTFPRRRGENEDFDFYNPKNAYKKFHNKLLQQLGPANSQRNIIYSPISLHTLLAYTYMGARGETAQELQSALELHDNQTVVGQMFQRLLNEEKITGTAKLIMANKMYHDQGLRVRSNLQQLAQYFGSELAPTAFSAPQQAAHDINKWVSGKTENRINNIVAPESLDPSTQAILINAIYFKANWQKEFSLTETQEQEFHVNRQTTVPVQMMFNDDTFRYGEFPHLRASVLEMYFKGTDMSMMIVLPDEIDGLRAVEEQFSRSDLSDIVQRMKTETVTVRLPKFKIEFESDMVEPLKNLGIKQAFSVNANLKGFFEDSQPVRISKVQHKAFIDVNEAGVEAAAASFAKITPLALPSKTIHFDADHPFLFLIRSPQAVYFVGHVVTVDNA